MLIREEFDRKESSQSSAQDSDSGDEIGPKANMSLLDQHSKLKQQAEGHLVSLIVCSKIQ